MAMPETQPITAADFHLVSPGGEFPDFAGPLDPADGPIIYASFRIVGQVYGIRWRPDDLRYVVRVLGGIADDLRVPVDYSLLVREPGSSKMFPGPGGIVKPRCCGPWE